LLKKNFTRALSSTGPTQKLSLFSYFSVFSVSSVVCFFIIVRKSRSSQKKRNPKPGKTKITLTGTLIGVVLFTIVAYLSGCSDQPSYAELERWRQDAIARDRAIVALHQKDKTHPNWQFKVQGQTATGKPVVLSLAKLQTLAKTSVWTTDPHHSSDTEAVFHFSGVAISALLDRFGVAPGVTDVTFVAHDAYRSTVSLADLRQYPIILALERDRKKISRSEGGPLYLVFPQRRFPQLEQTYIDRYWAFYVTDMIVGTEAIALRVGERVLDAAALNKLPHITIEEAVGYRLDWPASKVKLYGVRLQDVLAAAGLKLPQRGTVIVRGKSPIYHDPTNPIRIEAEDIKQCNILLATHWGDERVPIPARMGGPVTLAFSSTCQTPSDDRRWVTFVEKLEVTK
jgi:hypothetical protein